MKIAKYILIFLLTFATGLANAQIRPAPDRQSDIARALQKMRWDMRLGTAFTFIPGYGGGMSYYAAPGFSYPVNKRFSFHGGVIAGVNTLPAPVGGEEGMQKVTSGFTSFYGTAAYHAGPNVVFHATGVKSVHTFGRMNPLVSPSYDEISFGSTIRLGRNVTIGASVHFREYSPYSPFGGGYFD